MFNIKNYGYENVLRNISSSTPKLTRFADALANTSPTYLPIDTKRSTLDRVFDLLSVGNYVSAGLVRGIMPNNNISISEGVVGGLRAANPFGDGYEKGEHTYSKVLDDAGWKPTSTGGKIARGAVGLVGDIFLDPTTYLTLGGSALVKGTGKVGLEANHAKGLIKELATKFGGDASKIPESVIESVTKKGMSTDLAKDIISRHNTTRGIVLGADELEKSAETLSRQYNKLAGVRGVADDATLSLANAPFGKKIFGGLSDKSTTLAKGETLQKIGDATLSPAYTKLRDSVYGSKFGKLFSTKSTLYNLSKTDPSAVYEYIKAVEGVRSLEGNIRTAEKAIREIGNQFNLTPDESKEVIEIMEDKSLWNPVKKSLNEVDTNKYKEYIDTLSEKRNNDSFLLDELKSQKDILDKLAFANESEISGLKEIKKTLDAEYLSKLEKLNINRVANKDELLNLVHSFDESIGSTKTIDVNELEKIVSSYDDELKALDKSDESLLSKKQKLADMYNSKRKSITSEAKVIQDNETSNVSNLIDNYLSESKARYEARKSGVKLDAPETINKVDTVRSISKYILGDESAISPVIWDKKIEDLQKLMKKGATKDELAEYVTKHSSDYLSSSKQTMYSYIANKIGYKDWNSYYYDRIKKLVDDFSTNGGWDENEYNLYFSLRKAEKMRTAMIEDFNNSILKYGVDEGVSKYITDAANKEMMDDVFLDNGAINSTAKGGFKNTLDVQKGSWSSNDFADGRRIVHESKQPGEIVKRTEQTGEFADKTLSGKGVIFEGSNDKSKIIQDLTEKMFFSKGDFVPEKLNKSHMRWIEKVTNEIPKLLENTFHVEYADLTPKQTEFLYDMAIQSATKKMDDMFKYDKLGTAVAEESRKRLADFRSEAIKLKTQKGTRVEFMSGGKSQIGTIDSFKDATNGRVYTITGENGKVFDNVRMNQLTKFEADVKKLSVEEVIASSDSSKDFFERQHKLYTKVNDALSKNAVKRAELIKSKNEFQHSFKSLTDDYKSAVDNLSENIKQLEVDRQSLTARLASDDFKAIDTLSDSVKAYEELLNNEDALNTYISTMMDLQKPIDKVVSEPSVASIILDGRPNTKQNIIDVVEKLRSDFNTIGREEVGIGELSAEQFENMVDHYFPHILTDTGKRLFNLDGVSAPYDKSYGGSMSKSFNEFGETRTMRVPDGKGVYITNPTVSQINNYYKENFDNIVKGENVLSENISDVYIARMSKHSELMYDTEYIKEAVKGFGKPYNGELLNGHKPVMDFTTFREHSKSYASLATSQDVSQKISQYLSDNVNFSVINHEAKLEAYNIASLEGMDSSQFNLLTKKIYSKKIAGIIEDYVKKEITPAVREGIFKEKLSEFFTGTETVGYVDRLSYPLLEFNKSQIEKVGTYTESVINSHYSSVSNNIVKFINQNNSGLPKSAVDFISSHLDSPDDIRKSLQIMLRSADEVDAERINRWIDKLDKVDSLKFGEFNNVQDGIVAKFNQSRKNQLIKDQSNMLNIYDKFTHLIKLNQTTVLPSFHARNKMANTFNNWLAVGNDAVNVDFQKTAFRAVRSNGNIDDVLQIAKKDGSTASITWKELYDKAVEYGVTGEGFYAKDLNQADAANSFMFKKIPPQFNPTNTKDFTLYSKGAKIGNMVENQDRLIHFASQIKNGMSFDEAAESVEKFLFDYSDLTAFEQNVMKRIFPYYTWMRKNSALQLEMLLENPKSYKYIGQVEHGVEGMVNEEDRVNPAFLNDFALDWVQTPFTAINPEGREEKVLFNPNLPYMDLSKIPNPLNPIESAKDLFTQSNPLLKVPVERAINKNVYFDSPIVKEDDDSSTALAKRAEHVLSQLSLYNTGKDFATKSGVDLGLQGLNTLTGVKMLSYDYDKYKAMKIQELLKNPVHEKDFGDYASEFGGAVVEGFKDVFSKATSSIGKSLDSVGEDRPLKPDEYTGALRPISQSKYDRLSDSEKELYTPPTNDSVIYYHNRAIELEKEAMEKNGVAKKFVWSLFDAFKVGSRNKDYEFGEVTKVTDGDTFTIKIGNEEKNVRMLLVDTPETVDPRVKEPMPYGKEASNFSKNYLIGKDTKIYFDGEKTDKYGRLLGYVEVDGVDYNNKILEEGLGQVRYLYQPSYDRLDKYFETERKASESKKGLWSLDGYATPGVDDGYDTKYLNSIKRKNK